MRQDRRGELHSRRSVLVELREDSGMTARIYLVGGWNGGAGRTLTAALLAYGLHLQGRRLALVRQTHHDSIATIDPIETTLPLPCCELELPDPYSLPADLAAGLATMIHGADARFMDALHELALTEVGTDGDVVVDLCCNERAWNAATIRDAAVILVPARESIFELDWAVRGFAHARDTQRYRDLLVPTLVATIAPESGRARQREQLSGLLRDCDPDCDILPGDPSEVIVQVPFLDEATLAALFDERPIWQDPELQARCLAFATAVADRADAFMAMMLEHADEC
jgi:hypothetical protein